MASFYLGTIIFLFENFYPFKEKESDIQTSMRKESHQDIKNSKKLQNINEEFHKKGQIKKFIKRKSSIFK